MKFRRKPIIVEAWQFVMPKTRPEQPTSYGDRNPLGGESPGLCWNDFGSSQQHPAVWTHNGLVTIHEGDWIVEDVEGFFYPCKSEIFEATYDVIEEALE